MDFGSRLAEQRKQRKLSQVDAALLCDVSREMWGRYERGRAKPGSDVLDALAQAGWDVSYILTGKSVDERQSALEDRMDALQRCTRRSLELTEDVQKGELIRDVLLGDLWSRPEIIEAAIERYVALRQAQSPNGIRKKT